jgi:hypothetical protein
MEFGDYRVKFTLYVQNKHRLILDCFQMINSIALSNHQDSLVKHAD